MLPPPASSATAGRGHDLNPARLSAALCQIAHYCPYGGLAPCCQRESSEPTAATPLPTATAPRLATAFRRSSFMTLAAATVPSRAVTAASAASAAASAGGAARRVAVIGAGFAGLAAALTLQRSGRCEVTVLEAGQRAGGRACTQHIGDAAIELGEGPLCGRLSAAGLHGMEPATDHGVALPDGTKDKSGLAPSPPAQHVAAPCRRHLVPRLGHPGAAKPGLQACS